MKQSELGLSDYERRYLGQRRRVRNNLAVLLGLVLLMAVLNNLTQ